MNKRCRHWDKTISVSSAGVPRLRCAERKIEVDATACETCPDRSVKEPVPQVVDVCTTSIPRLLTSYTMPQFLGRMEDRGDFRLRWFFHLDNLPDLDRYWAGSLAQAQSVAPLFDEAVLIARTANLGYGGSILELLRRTENDVLWIEDDWEWLKPFRLADAFAACRDGYNFGNPGIMIGATSPNLWRRRVVDYLIDNFGRPERASERGIKHRLRGRFRSNSRRGRIPPGLIREIGRRRLGEFGFQKTFFNVPIKP